MRSTRLPIPVRGPPGRPEPAGYRHHAHRPRGRKATADGYGAAGRDRSRAGSGRSPSGTDSRMWARYRGPGDGSPQPPGARRHTRFLDTAAGRHDRPAPGRHRHRRPRHRQRCGAGPGHPRRGHPSVNDPGHPGRGGHPAVGYPRHGAAAGPAAPAVRPRGRVTGHDRDRRDAGQRRRRRSPTRPSPSKSRRSPTSPAARLGPARCRSSSTRSAGARSRACTGRPPTPRCTSSSANPDLSVHGALRGRRQRRPADHRQRQRGGHLPLRVGAASPPAGRLTTILKPQANLAAIQQPGGGVRGRRSAVPRGREDQRPGQRVLLRPGHLGGGLRGHREPGGGRDPGEGLLDLRRRTQRTLVKIYVNDDAGGAAAASQALAGADDPNRPVTVSAARGHRRLGLTCTLLVAADRAVGDVVAAATAAFSDPAPGPVQPRADGDRPAALPQPRRGGPRPCPAWSPSTSSR